MAELKKDGIRAAMGEQTERDTLKTMAQRNTDREELAYWEFDANGNPPKPTLRECPLCPDGGLPYFTRTVNGTNMIYVGCSRCGLELKAALLMVTPTKEQPSKDVVAIWNSRAVAPQGDAPLFEAKLLGFGEGDRITLCEPCLRQAIANHLVSFSCALPAHASPVAPSLVPEQDYSQEIAVGRKWLEHKDAAERIVARIADNDCLTCKHWTGDAVYAIAVELATAAATPSTATAAEQEPTWSSEPPKVDGVYWWRLSENDPDPDICETDLQYGTVYDIGEPQGRSIKELGGEWLGPIDPSSTILPQIDRTPRFQVTPVHPFGQCGYKYCDWPDGELRCNELRVTAATSGARAAAEEIADKWLRHDLPLRAGIHSNPKFQLRNLAEEVISRHFPSAQHVAASPTTDSDCQPGSSSTRAFNVIDDQMSKELRED